MRSFRTKVIPVEAGSGELKFPGFHGPVDYAISGETAKLKVGIARLRGSFTTTPEIAADAFHAGEGALTIESGAVLRINMLGHTEGGSEVFIELRV